MTLQTEIIIRSIKIVDIAYITVLYFFVGFFVAVYSDKFFVHIFGTEDTDKTNAQLVYEIVIQLVCISILIYIFRNIVQLIPFPLNGVYGFNHFRVKEVSAASLLTITILLFSANFQNKLTVLRNNILKNYD